VLCFLLTDINTFKWENPYLSGDLMPLVRINQELYDKIQAIMKRTGWRSIGFTLNKLLENVKSEDFFTYQSEVTIKIKKESS